MNKKTDKNNDLKIGRKYLINGFPYVYDGYSAFYNLRMYDENGKLCIFNPNKVKVCEYSELQKPSSSISNSERRNS